MYSFNCDWDSAIQSVCEKLNEKLTKISNSKDSTENCNGRGYESKQFKLNAKQIDSNDFVSVGNNTETCIFKSFDRNEVLVELGKYFDVEQLRNEYTKFQRVPQLQAPSSPIPSDINTEPTPLTIDLSESNEMAPIDILELSTPEETSDTIVKTLRRTTRSKVAGGLSSSAELASLTPTERKPSRKKEL